jgi:hypothetical protein
MRFRSTIVALGAVLSIAACINQTPVAPRISPAPTCPTCLPASAIAADLAQLRQALQASLPQRQEFTLGRDMTWIALARRAMADAGLHLDRQQLMVVVDRNPAIQQLALVFADPAGRWDVVGGSKVSTGQSGRRGYFITPTGVFLHDGRILDYRALGTFNDNHIRGLGVKGMRVWDFGWQMAQKGWESAGKTGDIRLLLHATDPTYLEQRLGRPASQGCIRIPAAMNQFLDVHGVLDRDYERLGRHDPAYAALLSPDLQPTPLAGNKLVVIDSSKP